MTIFPPSLADAVGVAIVGAGGWGKNHVRNFSMLPGAEVRYVCDRDEKIRSTIGASFPPVEVVSDIVAPLADRDVQAIVIATDAPSHCELAQQALQAGRDVFVEKPLCLSSRDAEILCKMAREKQRILMVGHLLLYHPAVERLKQLIEAGELGEVLYIYAQRVNLGVVRRDENAWWSLAPHDISVANYLLRASPEAVSATGSSYLQKDRGVEDVVFATLHYPRGRMAHILVGDRKMAVLDDTSTDQKLTVFDKGVEPPAILSYEEGVRIRTGDIHVPALKMVEPLRRECQAFLDAVTSRKAPIADGESGLEVVRALEAGARSLQRDGARVPVDRGSG